MFHNKTPKVFCSTFGVHYTIFPFLVGIVYVRFPECYSGISFCSDLGDFPAEPPFVPPIGSVLAVSPRVIVSHFPKGYRTLAEGAFEYEHEE